MLIVILLLVVVVMVYLFATAGSRRDGAVEDRVLRMIAGGKTYATFGELYFDAAKSYAIAKGAHAPEHNAASALISVGEKTYSVVFIRENDNGTTIMIEDLEAVERRFNEFSSR